MTGGSPTLSQKCCERPGLQRSNRLELSRPKPYSFLKKLNTRRANPTIRLNSQPIGHAHGRERKSGMGVTFLLSHCRKGVEWHVNRREIVGLVGIAPQEQVF